LQTKLAKTATTNATAVVADLWTTFVQNTPFRDSRILWGSFQHDNPRELHMLQTVYHNDVTAARRADTQRPISWLRQHGTCGDHLTARPSTLRQAGMGAFATRTLPASTIVAALPMIHIADRDRLDMYNLFPNEKGEWAIGDDTTVQGRQLLLNYCFGHAESTMLLCPYGPMASYINHNRTLANVRLQWGSPRKGNHAPQLLEETVDHIRSSYKSAKLAMELVAIREIQAGEEIFLDYGDEWEAAWRSHVANWIPVPDALMYFSAHQLNEFHDKSVRLRTAYEENEEQRYPDNVQLMCDVSCYFEAELVQELHAAGMLDEYLWKRNRSWWPCAILDSGLGSKGEYMYAIVLKDVNEPFEEFVVQDVPRDIIHFVDHPYSSDTYLPNVFRHDIRIPDKIFPQSWRNLPKGAK
jgi:SET domain